MVDDARYMIPANDAGFPGISFPSGLGGNGLPIGVHLLAAWNRDDLLLQVAAQVEKAKPEWFNMVAPIHVAKL
jgi:amidase